MAFASTIATLLLYFIRPQDWIPGLAGVNVVKPVIAMGLFGLMTRQRGRAGTGGYRFLNTPHEWLMLIYLGYIVVTSPEGFSILPEALALGAFFFLTLHTITSVRHLERFLVWWRWALIVVVVMALGALYGFDFTQSASMTAEKQGRLCLRHWMLDNPNALGHTLATLLPMLYFGLFRDKSATKKGIAVLLALLTGVCLWNTQSKGAFLVGGGVMVLAELIGRPWWVKVSVLAFAIGGGQAALSSLPRMSQMGDLRSDEGVAGRMMAWEIARSATHNTVTGEGWKHFAAVINWAGQAIPKATHCAYVKVGADLGIPGLLIFLSLLCTGARSLLTFQGPNRRMEELRRILLCCLACYVASGWMIDRAYHTEFFMLLGAIAAYHSLCLQALPIRASVSAAGANLTLPAGLRTIRSRTVRTRRPSALMRSLLNWRRYGITDFAVACIALQGVLATWDYVIASL